MSQSSMCEKLFSSEPVNKRKQNEIQSLVKILVSLLLLCFQRRKKKRILIFFRWLSSLWLNLVIADVKWHPIAFKMGFTAFQQATVPLRQLGRTHFPVWGKTCRQLPVGGLANRETLLTVPAPACDDLTVWFRWTDHSSLPHLKASTWKKKKKETVKA